MQIIHSPYPSVAMDQPVHSGLSGVTPCLLILFNKSYVHDAIPSAVSVEYTLYDVGSSLQVSQQGEHKTH